MKMLTAFTYELDDPQLAVEELLEQLQLDQNLEQHSAGLVTCYPEFLENGIVAALAKALPFDLVGCTTLGNATSGNSGTMMLALTVLTGDKLRFSSVCSAPLADDLGGSMAEACKTALAALDGEPVLALVFLPMINDLGGEQMLEPLNAALPGVPLFGTMACSENIGMEYAETIYNGAAAKEALTMLLVSGLEDLHFVVSSIPQDSFQKQRAVITGSQGNLLQTVNDLSFLAYMNTLGLTQGDGIEGLQSIPFLVDYNDGTQPVAKAIYLVTPEGYASCTGVMPEQSTLAIGAIDDRYVLKSAEEVLTGILETGGRNGLLMFPCLSRNMVLGLNALAELELAIDLIGDRLPYHLCYSGGEVCPVPRHSAELVNRFHAFTVVACIF